MTAEQVAEVKKETEAVIGAEYTVKAALVRKYLGDSNATTHPGFHYVFCRLAIEDQEIGIFSRLRLVLIFVVENLRRTFWNGKPRS